MIIVLKSGASDGEIADVERRITAMGYRPHTIRGQLRTVIGAIGDDRGKERLRSLESLESVESVTPILQPFKLASREVRTANSVVRVGDVAIGGPKVVVMAGPCSVESREQILQVAARVKAAGATVLRGGAFKPRTSPYAFQGLEEGGLKLLAEARRETGLPIITEVMEPATGHWGYVAAMAVAAVAAGADGLIIAVHPKPEEALSAGPQSLKPDRFAAVMARIARVARAIDRDV